MGSSLSSKRLKLILVLASSDPQPLIFSLSNARWLLKEESTSTHVSILEEQLLQICKKDRPTLASSIHRADAVMKFCARERDVNLY